MSLLLTKSQLDPAFSDSSEDFTLFTGDSKEILSDMQDEIFQCCITSPPYWGLRDYDIDGQIGAEETIDEYIENLVGIFREVRRTLRNDGTLWLNVGDSFTSGGRTWRDKDKKNPARGMSYRPATPEGLKPKDLIGVPWRLAFALQEDGWYLRTDIVWHKPNGQPESVKDRPTRCHEFVFLFSKSERYYYDHNAIKEPTADNKGLRNRRSVWSINTEAYKGAHFAVFPTELVKVCLLAGSNPGSLILDPFVGSGTVSSVCVQHGRRSIGIELNPEYAKLAQEKILNTERGLL